MGIQAPQGQLLQLFNVQEPRKKVHDAETGQPIQVVGVIYINFNQQFQKL